MPRAYHNKDARNTGYWSAEALQWVFGEEIIKGGAPLVEEVEKVSKVEGVVGAETKNAAQFERLRSALAQEEISSAEAIGNALKR